MLLDIIKARRAVFPAQYNDRQISEAHIKTLLEAANWAPTHRRTEPWRFKVFYSETSRRELGAFLKETYLKTAVKISEIKSVKIEGKTIQSSCVIAICYQPDPNQSVPEWEEVAATAMAVQNIWLAAHDLEIGCYWSSPSLKDHLANHIEMSTDEVCLGFLYMGHYDTKLEPGRRNSPISEKTVWL